MIEQDIYKDVELFWKQQAALYGDSFYIDLSQGALSPARADNVSSLRLVEQKIYTCTACELSSARQGIVTGCGNPKARVMCISGAPPCGGSVFEEEQDTLFDKILSAIGFARSEIFLTSMLKCSPITRRPPEESTFQVCSNHLFAEIEAVGPKLILALGERAAQILLRRTDPLESLRGNEQGFSGMSVFATYHPSQLLANTALKHGAWSDVQLLRRKYDELFGDKPSFA